MPSESNRAAVLADLCSRPISCFDCGHEYWFVGAEHHHPATCAACGSRAVSFAGSVRVTDTQVDDRFAREGSSAASLQVVAEDASTRTIVYSFAVDRDASTATLTAVRVATARVVPDNPHWSDALVPDAVVSAVEGAGFHFVPPATSTSSESSGSR